MIVINFGTSNDALNLEVLNLKQPSNSILFILTVQNILSLPLYKGDHFNV